MADLERGGVVLKPCPFCGDAPRRATRQDEALTSHSIVTWISVRCGTCDVGFDWPEDAAEGAEEMWNRRAPSAAQEAGEVLREEVRRQALHEAHDAVKALGMGPRLSKREVIWDAMDAIARLDGYALAGAGEREGGA